MRCYTTRLAAIESLMVSTGESLVAHAVKNSLIKISAVGRWKSDYIVNYAIAHRVSKQH